MKERNIRLLYLLSIFAVIFLAWVFFSMQTDSDQYSSISGIKAFAIPQNWDDNPGNDGIVIMILFLDEEGHMGHFVIRDFSIMIKIFSAQIDSDSHFITGSILFEETYTITDNKSQYPEIRISYNDLPPDIFTGSCIEVAVDIPGAGTFTDTTTFP